MCQAGLINAILSDGIGIPQVIFLSEPDHGEEPGRVVGAMKAVFVRFVDSCDFVDVNRVFRRECSVQDTQDLGDVLVEVLDIDIGHGGHYIGRVDRLHRRALGA